MKTPSIAQPLNDACDVSLGHFWQSRMTRISSNPAALQYESEFRLQFEKMIRQILSQSSDVTPSATVFNLYGPRRSGRTWSLYEMAYSIAMTNDIRIVFVHNEQDELIHQIKDTLENLSVAGVGHVEIKRANQFSVERDVTRGTIVFWDNIDYLRYALSGRNKITRILDKHAVFVCSSLLLTLQENDYETKTCCTVNPQSLIN